MKNRGVNEAFTEAARVALQVKNVKGERLALSCLIHHHTISVDLALLPPLPFAVVSSLLAQTLLYPIPFFAI
jgi:hypothetical protein